MQYNELSAAEHDRMVQVARPVTDRIAAAYDPATVKLYLDELARVRKWPPHPSRSERPP